MYEIQGGPCFRPNDDPGIKTFIGGSVPDVCLWLVTPELNWGFSLALNVCDLRADDSTFINFIVSQ